MKPKNQRIYNALYQDHYESFYNEVLSYLDVKEIVDNVKNDGSILSKFSVTLSRDHSDREEDRNYEEISDLEPLFGNMKNNNINKISFSSKLADEPIVSHLIAPNSGYYNKMVFNEKTAEFLKKKEQERKEQEMNELSNENKIPKL